MFTVGREDRHDVYIYVCAHLVAVTDQLVSWRSTFRPAWEKDPDHGHLLVNKVESKVMGKGSTKIRLYL